MKMILLLFILTVTQAYGTTMNFVVQVHDRSISVVAPEKKTSKFTVMVENRSLSDQIAKFTVEGKLLKYVKVKSGQSEAVEIENKTAVNVVFVPVSPAFQEVELIFGKKAYEIPSKE